MGNRPASISGWIPSTIARRRSMPTPLVCTLPRIPCPGRFYLLGCYPPFMQKAGVHSKLTMRQDSLSADLRKTTGGMMRNWIRGAGILALVACTSAGCIDESDSRNPGASYQDGTVPAANKKSAEPTKVTATLAEWTIGLSKTTIPTGTISFVITNNGTEEHAFEVTGANQEWKTDPIK